MNDDMVLERDGDACANGKANRKGDSTEPS